MMPTLHRRWRKVAARAFGLVLLGLTVVGGPVLADGSPARPLPSPAAANLGGSDSSQYWDLTAQLDDGHYIFARFQITNQGPGENNGTAIGHVVKPNGKEVKFRNGRLESGWTLSEDRLDLDVGKCHLDMHPPRYRLRVNKSDVRIRLDFFPNALTSLPEQVTGKHYRVDLLALGADAKGSLRFDKDAETFAINGHATLTHTVATRAETDLNQRRFELIAGSAERPLYAVQFLDEDGDLSSWAGWLEPRCDPAFATAPFPSQTPAGAGSTAAGASDSLGDCVQVLGAASKVELNGRDSRNGDKKRSDKDSYWVPRYFDLASTDEEAPLNALSVEAAVGERLLKYEALDDLPGAIRWLARLSTEPRRVWSVARFVVTLPPSLDSEPHSIQKIQNPAIQSQGVAVVSYTNEVSAD